MSKIPAIYSDSFDGSFRNLYNKQCVLCNKDYLIPAHLLETRKYCSKLCAQKASINRIKTKCGYCSKEIEKKKSSVTKSGYFFCNRKCKDNSQSLGNIKEILPSHYKENRTAYRKRALALLGNKCSNKDCVITKNNIEIKSYMLDVDHIDEDRSNNRLENLQVLCVWCHRIKTSKNWGIHDRRGEESLQDF